jgi:tRNA pseudouridine55 synthase
VDGILIIDKPAGMTSHDVVNRVRRILKTKKVGHTGTLDPFATGVMVVLAGKATRLAQFLDKDEKEYEALVRFGFETDTGDRTGEPRPQIANPKVLTVLDVEAVLPNFRGDIEQTPPMYSAKKIAGKKLYEHARKGVEIEREPVRVMISELEPLHSGPSSDLEFGTWDLGLRVVCSAGTYIRTLAEDLGRAVGVGAHLAELRRTRAGKFRIEQAASLEKLGEGPERFLLPMDKAVAHLSKVVLGDDRIEKTKNGLATRTDRSDLKDGDAAAMFAPDGNILAIGFYDASERCIRPKIVLV